MQKKYLIKTIQVYSFFIQKFIIYIRKKKNEAVQKASFFMPTLRRAQCDILIINWLSY